MRIAAILSLSLLLGCAGIDARVALEHEKGVGDIRLAEAGFEEVSSKALRNLRSAYDGLDRLQTENDLLREPGESVSKRRILEIMKAAGERRKNAYVKLDEIEAAANVNRGNFRNALVVQQGIANVLQALVERKGAEAKAQAQGMGAARKAGELGKKAAVTRGVP